MTNESEPECPLCRSRNVRHLELLQSKDLRYVYRRRLGLDVSAILQRDLDLYRCARCELRFFAPPAVGDQAFYSALQRFDWYYLHDKYEFGYAEKHVHPLMSVLEIGAGRGAFATRLPANARYTGLEFSETAAAESERSGIVLLRQSIEEHARTNSCKYEIVCAFQVLEHVPNPRSFIEAASSCLKNGGKLIISVPSEDGFIGAEIDNPLNMPPHHVTRWTDAALTNLAAEYSLQLLDIHHEPLADMHIPAFASSIVDNGLLALLRRRRSILDPIVESVAFRAIAAPFRSLVEKAIRRSGWRPAGHSVCAIYAK